MQRYLHVLECFILFFQIKLTAALMLMENASATAAV